MAAELVSQVPGLQHSAEFPGLTQLALLQEQLKTEAHASAAAEAERPQLSVQRELAVRELVMSELCLKAAGLGHLPVMEASVRQLAEAFVAHWAVRVWLAAVPWVVALVHEHRASSWLQQVAGMTKQQLLGATQLLVQTADPCKAVQLHAWRCAAVAVLGADQHVVLL